MLFHNFAEKRIVGELQTVSNLLHRHVRPYKIAAGIVHNMLTDYLRSCFLLEPFYPWENLGMMMEAPLLLIAGDIADTLPDSQAAYDADNGPKELYLVKGATHVDLYDKEPYVSEAVAKLIDFFGKNLK